MKNYIQGEPKKTVQFSTLTIKTRTPESSGALGTGTSKARNYCTQKPLTKSMDQNTMRDKNVNAIVKDEMRKR